MVIYLDSRLMTEPHRSIKKKTNFLIKSLKLNYKHTTLHFNNKKSLTASFKIVRIIN